MLTSLSEAQRRFREDPQRAVSDVAAAVRFDAENYGAYITVAESPAPPTTFPDGPLAGVPFGVKDNIETAGLPTTAGTGLLRNHRPARDAAVVQTLLNAGAYPVGKTNMHELAMGVTSNNATFGPVRHPLDRLRSPGGSSGGSAVAVATGSVPFALGTDTGGSVRIPASFCGITGYRPTVGRYSAEGLIRISWTRDTIGILAGSVADVARVDGVLADSPLFAPPPSAGEIRLGVPRRDLYDDLDPEVARVSALALDRLAGAGITLVDVDMGTLRSDSLAAGFPIVEYETDRALTKYLEGVLDGRLTLRQLTDAIGSPDVHAILQAILDAPTSIETYQAALEAREQLRSRYRATFQTHGIQALIYPTVVRTAPLLDQEGSFTHNGRPADVLRTIVANATASAVAGTPSISLPAGFAADGLPIGITLDGLMDSDLTLLATAASVESLISNTWADL